MTFNQIKLTNVQKKFNLEKNIQICYLTLLNTCRQVP